MDFYKVPIGFGMALAQNEAAMLRYARLSEPQKQDHPEPGPQCSQRKGDVPAGSKPC